MWIATGPPVIHSSGQTISSLAHIEGITLSASEEVNEVAGGAGGMGVDGIGEVGDRASEEQAAGVYGAGYVILCLTSYPACEGVQGILCRWQECRLYKG